MQVLGRRCKELLKMLGMNIALLLGVSMDFAYKKRYQYLRGNRCLNSGSNDKYKAASAMLGYGVKIAKMPVKVAATNKGCFRRRMVSPGI